MKKKEGNGRPNDLYRSPLDYGKVLSCEMCLRWWWWWWPSFVCIVIEMNLWFSMASMATTTCKATISRQSEIRLRNWYETNIDLGSTHQKHFITCACRKKKHTQQQQQQRNPMETDLSKDLHELSSAHIWQKIPCQRMAEIEWGEKTHMRFHNPKWMSIKSVFRSKSF